MTTSVLSIAISGITPADQGAMAEAARRWDSIAKPIGGLGLLEEAVIRAAGVQGTADVSLDRKALAVFCADNGVTEEGVTQTGPEVTASVAASMAWGEACVCRMAWTAGAQVFPVDIGIAHPVEEGGLLRRHVTRGTRSIAKGPAMTRDEAVAAVVTGITLAEELKGRGYRLLAAGEMGIGNTTTAAAVTAVLLGRRVEEVTGRGAGLSDEGLERKIAVIRRAIEVNAPDPGTRWMCSPRWEGWISPVWRAFIWGPPSTMCLWYWTAPSPPRPPCWLCGSARTRPRPSSPATGQRSPPAACSWTPWGCALLFRRT